MQNKQIRLFCILYMNKIAADVHFVFYTWGIWTGGGAGEGAA